MYFFTGLYDIDLGFTNYLPSTFTFVLLNVSINSLILGTDIDIEFLT